MLMYATSKEAGDHVFTHLQWKPCFSYRIPIRPLSFPQGNRSDPMHVHLHVSEQYARRFTAFIDPWIKLAKSFYLFLSNVPSLGGIQAKEKKEKRKKGVREKHIEHVRRDWWELSREECLSRSNNRMLILITCSSARYNANKLIMYDMIQRHELNTSKSEMNLISWFSKIC